MDIRARTDIEDLRGATEARNRAWRVGYRGIVDGDVIDDALRPTDDEFLEEFGAELDDEAGHLLVAEDDGAIIGYARARYAGTAEYVGGIGGELVELYVDPARWRDGVGTSLLDAAEDWLPEMTDSLATRVLAENERGRSFLEANGLVEDEEIDADVAGHELPHVVYRIEFED